MAEYIKVYDAELKTFLTSKNGPVGRYLHRQGKQVERAAKRQVGKKTGALRSSIHMRHLLDARGQYIEVKASTPYALAHHEGTKPHVIKPKNAPILRFSNKSGSVIHARTVNHPGTKPNRYLSDNLRLVR